MLEGVRVALSVNSYIVVGLPFLVAVVCWYYRCSLRWRCYLEVVFPRKRTKTTKKITMMMMMVMVIMDLTERHRCTNQTK